MKSILELANQVLVRKRSLTPQESLKLKNDLEIIVSTLYNQCRHRTKKQKQQSLFALSKRMGFESTDYTKVCGFLSHEFGISKEKI